MIQHGDHAVGFCDIVRSTALDVVGIGIAAAVLVKAIALRGVTVAGGDGVVVVGGARNYAGARNAGAVARNGSYAVGRLGTESLAGEIWIAYLHERKHGGRAGVPNELFQRRGADIVVAQSRQVL